MVFTVEEKRYIAIVDNMNANGLIDPEKRDEIIEDFLWADHAKQQRLTELAIKACSDREGAEAGRPEQPPLLLIALDGLEDLPLLDLDSRGSKHFSHDITGGGPRTAKYLPVAAITRAQLPYMNLEVCADIPSRWYAYRIISVTSLYASAEGQPSRYGNYVTISKWYLEKAQARAVELAAALDEEEKGLRPRSTYLDVLPESECIRDLLRDLHMVEDEYDYEEISAPKRFTGAAAGRSILKKPAASAEPSGMDANTARCSP